jgi:hypothetical protein
VSTVRRYNDEEVRTAGHVDAGTIGQLLHDFNTEFDEGTPTPVELAERIQLLLEVGDTVVLLAGTGPDGLRPRLSRCLGHRRHDRHRSPRQ